MADLTRTVIDVSDAIVQAMVNLGMNGRYDVHLNGSRSTGYAGRPTGDDFTVTVVVEPMPPIGQDSTQPV